MASKRASSSMALGGIATTSTPAEHEPFLGPETFTTQREILTKLWTWRSLSVVQAFVLTIYTMILFYGFPAQPSTRTNPIHDLVFKYQPTMTITAPLSPYAGGPKPSIDKAWHDLLGNVSLRVSQAELNSNGNHRDSVAFSDNKSHLVWLGVFHQLHCLKELRQLHYRDYYFPNMTEDEAYNFEGHINHCIDMLRQALMCNPDTTLTTFTWGRSQSKPVLDIRPLERQCVDWDAFMESILPRVVGEDEVRQMSNPLLNTAVAPEES